MFRHGCWTTFVAGEGPLCNEADNRTAGPSTALGVFNWALFLVFDGFCAAGCASLLSIAAVRL